MTSTLDDLKAEYVKALIMQYRNKPRAKATIGALTSELWLDGLALVESSCFNLDTALGAQLDVIGRIVGVNRNVFGLDLSHTFFELTAYSGTPSGVNMQRYADSPDGPEIMLRYHSDATYAMSDFEFRALIKLKIIYNNTKRTLRDLKLALLLAFGTEDPFDQKNLLLNNSFEIWSGGTSVAPDSWEIGFGSVAREGTIIKNGLYSAKITSGYLYQDIQDTKGIAYWKNKTVTFGCWVYSTAANKAYLFISDGVTLTSSSYHTGNSTWQFLTVTKTITAPASLVQIGIITGATSISYFDGAFVVEGESINAVPEMPINIQDNLDSSMTYFIKQPYYNVFIVAGYLGIVPKPMGVAYTLLYI